MDGRRVIVVIPTYNERDTIEAVLRPLLGAECEPDVLIVDDSSPDGTRDIVQRLASQAGGRVRLLERAAKDGLGRAYAAGFADALGLATYDVIVQMDADGSHQPQDVDRLVAATDYADLVIGSRYTPGGSSAGLSWSRERLSRGGNAYARALLRLGIRDLTGGFKAWRADVLARLDLSNALSDGYAFQVETTTAAVRTGARVVEVPITFRERLAGQSKMSWKVAAEAAWLVPLLHRRYPAAAPDARD